LWFESAQKLTPWQVSRISGGPENWERLNIIQKLESKKPAKNCVEIGMKRLNEKEPAIEIKASFAASRDILR
jgi:hypothetical protein